MEVFQEAEEGLRNYFVQFLGLWNSRPIPDLRLVGSGTLVDIDGRGFILTAGHVWNAVNTADTLHISLVGRQVRLKISVRDIVAKMIWKPSGPEEWGPDLALLEIPAENVGHFRAYKTFLNFEKQRSEYLRTPPRFETSLWAVYGAVEQFSNVSVDPERRSLDAELVARAFIGGIVDRHSIDGYDYCDAGVETSLPGVPTSFGGVSGGGLWEVSLSVSGSGKWSWDGKRRLRGVAFWQSPIESHKRVVRCHGPRSIYESAWI